MPVEFHKLVETIKHLDLEDKLYLKNVFDKVIIAESRRLIKKNAKKSLKEYKANKIKFGSIEDLKKEVYGD